MKRLLTIALFAAGLAAASASQPFVYVPFAGTNHHTWTESSPVFSGESYTNGMPILNWPDWAVTRAWGTNFHLTEARLGSLETLTSSMPDADTNAIVRSGQTAAVFTNGFTWTEGTTNTLPWATVTNTAGVTYTLTAGAAYLRYSVDGTNYLDGADTFVTTGRVQYAFYPQGVGTPAVINPVVTNFTVWTQTRPDLFARTNNTVGQVLTVQAPLARDHAAPKGYVDDVVAAAISSQQGPSQLNGAPLEFSAVWEVSSSSSSTNTGTWQVNYLGAPVVTVLSPAPGLVNIARISISGTNASVYVATNGLSTYPLLQFSRKLSPANWAWLTTSNSISGTNYLMQFRPPYTDTCFVRAAVPSTLPTLLSAQASLYTQLTNPPTASQIGGTVGSVTNHALVNINGQLIDYWSDGTTRWSKVLAP